jgi:hypothetical protein
MKAEKGCLDDESLVGSLGYIVDGVISNDGYGHS